MLFEIDSLDESLTMEISRDSNITQADLDVEPIDLCAIR
jgi:hypothetical protein